MRNNTREAWAPAVSTNFAHLLRASLIDYFLVLFGREVRVSSAKARTCLHPPPTPSFILTIPQLSTVHVCVLSCFRRVRLFVTLWTVAHPQGSSVRGILQARILEWVAMPSSRGSSPPTDRTHVSDISCIGRWVLYHLCYLGSPLSTVVNCNFPFGYKAEVKASFLFF